MAYRGSYTRISLKALRDQILQRVKGTNVVFGWGLNDERLFTDPYEPTEPGQKPRPQYLQATMLH